MMKKLAFPAVLAMLLSAGCGSPSNVRVHKAKADPTATTVEYSELEEVDGVYYLYASDEPYTGRVTTQAQGEMVKGRKVGQWLEYYDEDRLEEEEVLDALELIEEMWAFIPGAREESWDEYIDRGPAQAAGSYLHGREVGLWRMHVDGRLFAEVNFRNGKEDGLFLVYHTNGQPMMKGRADDGEMSGTIKVHRSDGTPAMEFTTSQVRMFYPNGQLMMEAAIDAETEEMHGPASLYYPDGTIGAKGRNEDGLEEGLWLYYHPNGRLEEKGNYAGGKRTGEWIFYDSDGEEKGRRDY